MFAVGGTKIGPNANDDLWFVFDIAQGALARTLATLGSDCAVPAEVAALRPTITVRAERATWELIGREQIDAFHHRVQDGQVHITGDFRIFARNAGSLLKTAEITRLWLELDRVIQEVRGEVRGN